MSLVQYMETGQSMPREAPHQRARPHLVLNVIVAAIAITVLAAMTYRITLGMPVDEPFFLSIPYRFVLGDRPFIDEYNVAQTSSFLVYPLIWLWVHVAHGPTGICLYIRAMSLLFLGATSLAVYGYMRRHLERRLSLLVALIPLVFVPSGIQSLGYNTLGGGFLTMAVFLVARGLQTERARPVLMGGIASALAVIAYPTLLVSLAAIIVALAFNGNPGRKQIWHYVIGISLTLTPFVGYLFTVGANNLIFSYSFTQSQHVRQGGWAHLLHTMYGIAHVVFLQPFLIAFVACFVLIRFTSNNLARRVGIYLALLLVPGIPLAFSAWWTAGNAAFICISSAGIAIACLRRDIPRKGEIGLVAVPSLVAAAAATTTSNNGDVVASIGLLPLVAITLLWLSRLAMTAGPGFTWKREACVLWSVGGIVLSLITVQYWSISDQGYRLTATQTLSTGPYAGIRMSPQSAQLITDISAVLNRTSRRGDTVFFFNNFPAGYLLTSLRPDANTVWTLSALTYPGTDTNAAVDYFAKRHRYPSFAVQILRGQQYEANNPLVALFTESGRYKTLVSNPDYIVYHLPETAQ